MMLSLPMAKSQFLWPIPLHGYVCPVWPWREWVYPSCWIHQYQVHRLTLEQKQITVNSNTCQQTPQKGDSLVEDWRMAPPLGKNCSTSKSLILSRLLSFQYNWALLSSPDLSGGYFVFPTNKIQSYPLFNTKLSITWRRHTSMDPPYQSQWNVLAVDRCTGSTFWANAIAKEMENAWVIQQSGGWQEFSTLVQVFQMPHDLWYKMEDFGCKAHLVA